MSGTSGDGVDTSIIQSDGDTEYKVISDKYFKYNQEIYKKIHSTKEKIKNSRDLYELSNEISILEKEITQFHATAIKKIINNFNNEIDFIGFHGQTIFNNADEKISIQLRDGNLLYKLTKKKVIYNFRKNDLENGGQGAPLTPIFHSLIVRQNNISLPACILNIGGISNITIIGKNSNSLFSRDIGPGNCVIDEWIRKKSHNQYDNNGLTARAGKCNNDILTKLMTDYSKIKNKLSLDVKNFDISDVQELSLEDGAATLSNLTAKVLGTEILKIISKKYSNLREILVCGGGRKNKFLLEKIKKEISKNIVIKSIDEYGINGDFVESQAFAYLAIKSYLGYPISFPNTTGVKNPCVGGIITKN